MFEKTAELGVWVWVRVVEMVKFDTALAIDWLIWGGRGDAGEAALLKRAKTGS